MLLTTALVTGGAGFIGSHLVEALVEKGIRVRALDSLVKGKLASIKAFIDQGKVDFVEGDITNKDTVDEVMKDVDYVFHTAGIHIERSVKSPDDCISTNIQGSYNVFFSALKHNVKRVIFSSSASVYGNPKKLPMREDDPLLPVEPYGAGKLFCEHLLQHLAKKGLTYNSLRYFNVYGERQATHAYYTTVVTHFIKSILNNEPPVIDGKGDQSMDFVHVSDVVRANLLAMESETVNQEFNIGTGVSTSIAELAEIILKKLNKDMKPLYRERDVYATHRRADTQKAEQLLGFRAEVAFEDGIVQVAQEIAEQLRPVYQQPWHQLNEEQFSQAVDLFIGRLKANNFPLQWFQGKKGLDLGCKSGRIVQALLHLGAGEVVGVDASAEKLRERIADKRAVFINGNLHPLDFPDEWFDFVSCNGLLHRLENYELVLEELKRVVKKGGYLFLYVPDPQSIDWEVVDALREAGQRFPVERFTALIQKYLNLPTNTLLNFTDLVYTPTLRRFSREEMQAQLKGYEVHFLNVPYSHMDTPFDNRLIAKKVS